MQEPEILEINVWTRGVVMDKEGRDVTFALARAAQEEGKFVQAFDNYVDQPDRVNVPMRKYARISAVEIEDKYVYENHEPNIVVLVEESLLKGMNVLRGMRPGGTLIVNSHRPIADLVKFLPPHAPGTLRSFAVIHAERFARRVMADFLGAEGASVRGGLGRGIAGPIIGATARVGGFVSLDAVRKVVSDPAAAERGWESVQIRELGAATV
ncbi:MAG TPA: 2-oxoacid:acceptor oxidoreductase family protein [Thermodesulfobacteriota bacterium]